MKNEGEVVKLSLPRGYTKLPVEELESLYREIEDRRTDDAELAETLKHRLRKVIRRRKGSLSIATTTPSIELDSGLPSFPVHNTGGLPVGGANCLLDPISIVHEQWFRVVKEIACGLIGQTDGITPTFSIEEVRDDRKSAVRFVVRWSIPRFLSIEDLLGVFKVTQESFRSRQVTGHKSVDRPKASGWEQVISYYDVNDHIVKGRRGVYFGPEGDWDNHATGVIVSRQFKNTSEAMYLQSEYPDEFLSRWAQTKPKKCETFIEVRLPSEKEKFTQQEDALYLVVQLAFLFAKQKRLEKRLLMAAIFKALNRVGTAPIAREKLFGMREILEAVERTLLLPLEQPVLAQELGIVPESILEVGVKGVGKTFLAHYLMAGDYAAIFVAINCSSLLIDLQQRGASILERIDQISDECQLPVVLIIDDIDIVLDKKEKTVAMVLNWMQSIRQKGFYILATTNYPERIDDRMMEPGRLSRILHVDLPNPQDRCGVLDSHTKDLPIAEKERQAVIKWLAKETKGWTQRFLWELVQEAARNCGLALLGGKIQSQANGTEVMLKREHFEQALKELSQRIDKKSIGEENDRVHKFVSKKRQEIGFRTD